MSRIVVFSDIDGTLAHYLEDKDRTQGRYRIGIVAPPEASGVHLALLHAGSHQEACASDVLQMPASSGTGRRAWVSVRSIEAVARLRKRGVLVVLISGARSSTVLSRLPFLPQADAIVTENGGRIWLADAPWPSGIPLREDVAWARRHTPTTGSGEDALKAPEDRPGALWDAYRQFVAAGMLVDAAGYTAAFRVKAGATSEDVAAGLVKALPQGLASSVNLGNIDVYPATSGKANAARYLLEAFGAKADAASVLCDDDNDIELANAVGHAYLPSVSSESMQEVANANPKKFYVAQRPFVFGTEEALSCLESRLNAIIDSNLVGK